MHQPRGLWAHSGGDQSCCCCCTQQPLPPAQDHCSESADLCMGSRWEVKKPQQAQAAATLLAEVQTLDFTPTSSLCWRSETSPECLGCSAPVPLAPPDILSSQTLCLHCNNPVPISASSQQLLKPTLKSNQHVLQCWCRLLSAPRPALLLSVYARQLSRLTHRRADATPETDSVLMTTGC